MAEEMPEWLVALIEERGTLTDIKEDIVNQSLILTFQDGSVANIDPNTGLPPEDKTTYAEPDTVAVSTEQYDLSLRDAALERASKLSGVTTVIELIDAADTIANYLRTGAKPTPSEAAEPTPSEAAEDRAALPS